MNVHTVGGRDERGALTPFVVVIGLALLVMVGLVVDGGGTIRAMQRADAIAGQSARAGGEQINTPDAVRGEPTQVDADQARQAAQQYLSASHIDGTVSIINGTRLKVTTTTTYQPVFLGLIGIGTQTTHGSAEVRLVRGVDTQEATP